MSPTPDASRIPADSSRPTTLRAQVLALAIPALVEQLLSFFVALYDTTLAGYISTADHEVGLYTTTVGIASYLGWLASLLFALVGMGTTALVARAKGDNDLATANRLANRSLFLVAPLAMMVVAVLYFAAPLLAGRVGLEAESADVLVRYLRRDAFGQLLFGFCLIGSAALRGMGDMRTPMYILGGVNLVNILVSTTLVLGTAPGAILSRKLGWESWGVDGIVSGTLTARLLGGALMLGVLARGVSGLKLLPSLMIPDRIDVVRILRIGIPAAFEGATMWVGQWLFLEIISRLGTPESGSAYKAAHMIGMDAEALTYLPATAWGYAAASLVGQNLGAGNPDQARRLTNEAAKHAVIIALVGSTVYFFGAELIFQVMTQEAEVRRIGIPALRFLSLYQLPLAVVIVYLHAIRGAGATRAVAIINSLGVFLIRLPVGYLMGIVLGFGLIGAWSGMCLDVLIRSVIARYYFSRGTWSRTEV